MKLTWKPYWLELKYPFTIASYSRTMTPVVLTEIEYDGIVGYGEASLPQYLGETQETVSAFLTKINLSQFKDPTQIEEILNYVDHIAEGNTAAKASIDIALHDLVGKIGGMPWWQIWELDRENTPDTTFTIGIDTDDVIREKVNAVKADFKILKIKLGSEDDKHLISTIRSVTDLPLAVDANQGWVHREQALEMVCWLKEQGVVLIEQPMNKNDLDSTAWLTERSPLPIYADESVQRLKDVSRLKGVFSGINIKLMKCTGMHEARKMIELASAMKLNVMLGCMTETSCAISAMAQLSPLAPFADLDGALLIKNDCFEGMTIKNGKIILNDFPGIGINSK